MEEALKTMKDIYEGTIKDLETALKASMALRKTTEIEALTDAINTIDRVYSTTIEALEKQIPEEPELEADGYDDDGNWIYECGYCPDCRHEFEIAYDSPDYCPDCGKHLKWPDWVK